MSLIDRVKGWFSGSGTEGSFRGPFSLWGEFGNPYEVGSLEDGWNRNLSGKNQQGIAALHAAISAYTSAFMLMPMVHRKKLPSGGWETIQTSALSRWIDKPNYFQTPAEFWSSGIRQLMQTGNAVAVGVRNDRSEIVSTIWVQDFSITVEEETGAIFYQVTMNGRDMVVPQRDVLHLRINTEQRQPLQGHSNVVYCAYALATNAKLNQFLNSYLNNRASPSYALSTDMPLNADQMRQLRSAWNEQSKQLASGGVPILGNGLKPQMLGVAPGDTLLVETFNMTVEDIARAFSIPRALLGVAETASNAENLYRAWVSLGLGSLIEMVEQSVERLFALPKDHELNFESDALLRLDASAQMEIVAKGVTSGILSPDEGRAKVGYGPIRNGFGEVPAMQQQMVPLDLLSELHQASLVSKIEPEPEQQEEPDAVERDVNPEILKAQVINLRDRLRKSA